MKSFLILGQPLDPHANYVAWALDCAGYRPIFINSTHDNCSTQTTLYIDEGNNDFTTVEWKDADAVWCRRLSSAPVEKGEDNDDQFRLVEERRFTKWLIGMQEDRPIRWINRPTPAQAAENKFRQLQLAKFHGIGIPRTLITANPDRFRAFLEAEEVIVAKPLDAYWWEEKSGESLATFATVLDYDQGSQLSDDDIAQCVTIYQQRIKKVADLRVVVMGADVIAYKIKQDGEQHFDFRIGFFHENHLKYEPISVPAALRKKMIRFMDSLGINFASADFALTANGEFIFLDLNPNGQWLFIETACPEARVGQKFCSFFTHGSINHSTEKLFGSYLEYTESAAGRSFAEAFRRSAAGTQPVSAREKRGGEINCTVSAQTTQQNRMKVHLA
jgi:hypothetical protein